MRDSKALSEISRTIASEIDAAATGLTSWEEVCKCFVTHFPGSYACVLNQNFVSPEFSFQAVENLEANHLQSYMQHYAFINPWNTFWKSAPSGSILVSQRDNPASQYHNGEFYNDWMRRTGDFESAVGLKLQIDRAETVYLPVHYAWNLAETYDRELEFVLANIRPALQNALQLKRTLRQMGETASARAAIVGRTPRIALVVDYAMQLREANTLATEAFSKGNFISCRGRKVVFSDAKFTEMVQKVCRGLMLNSNFSAPKLTFESEGHHWLTTFLRLPDVAVGGLVASRPLFLIQITDIYSPSVQPDLLPIIEAFGLTPTESSLCKALSSGLALAEAASEIRISYENARQRLKSIFQKTGTSSQVGLRLLLAQF
ncbi:helix-turn-helix transcriptional regulator [Rhizobium giardinii]|uniref:helix-turn-helix transcriptional regulator n=1 Tax=Rhizobium giardinii TaxID=56731 RepID=UPI003D6DB064